MYTTQLLNVNCESIAMSQISSDYDESLANKMYLCNLIHRYTGAYMNRNPGILSGGAVQRDWVITSLHRERGIVGRNAHSLGAQAAASYQLQNAVFRCEHAPSFLEILLDNSVQQKNEHSLKRASDCEEVMKNQCPDSCSQTSEQPVEPEQDKDRHSRPEVRQAIGLLAHVRYVVDFFHHGNEDKGIDNHDEEDWCEECAVESASVYPAPKIEAQKAVRDLLR